MRNRKFKMNRTLFERPIEEEKEINNTIINNDYSLITIDNEFIRNNDIDHIIDESLYIINDNKDIQIFTNNLLRPSYRTISFDILTGPFYDIINKLRHKVYDKKLIKIGRFMQHWSIYLNTKNLDFVTIQKRKDEDDDTINLILHKGEEKRCFYELFDLFDTKYFKCRYDII